MRAVSAAQPDHRAPAYLHQQRASRRGPSEHKKRKPISTVRSSRLTEELDWWSRAEFLVSLRAEPILHPSGFCAPKPHDDAAGENSRQCGDEIEMRIGARSLIRGDPERCPL
jgi:hypothetical protein